MLVRELLLISSFRLAAFLCRAETLTKDFGRTLIAQASGRIGTAISSLTAGTSSFFHLNSGYKFVVEIAPKNRLAPLPISYSRGDSEVVRSMASTWFIGSGHVGRSFRGGTFHLAIVNDPTGPAPRSP